MIDNIENDLTDQHMVEDSLDLIELMLSITIVCLDRHQQNSRIFITIRVFIIIINR